MLHYAIGVFLERNFAVAEVSLPYQEAEYGREQTYEAMKHDFALLLQQLVKQQQYEKVCFIAKSISTVGVAEVIKEIDAFNSSIIWLTPLLQEELVPGAMLQFKGRALCIVGESDPQYIETICKQLKENEQLTIISEKGANHSLEYEGNMNTTLQILFRK